MYQKDILLSEEQYILHQCNCTTTYAKGLSHVIFSKYPYADTYKSRKLPGVPGTIDILGDESNRLIINAYAQYYPGKANRTNDSKSLRLRWFEECLEKVCKIEGLKSVCMPELIGCGLAGGNKDDYKKIIDKYMDKITIILY